jgi:hypothetical protein
MTSTFNNAGNTTYYFSPVGSASASPNDYASFGGGAQFAEPSIQYPIPNTSACTLGSLNVRVARGLQTTAPTLSGITLTVRVAATNTAITCTTNASGICSDVTHTASVSPGALVSYFASGINTNDGNAFHISAICQ